MNGRGLISAGLPAVIAAVAVDADAAEREGVEPRKVRHDEGQMAGCADHRVRLVCLALPRPIARVGMHVGDHTELAGLAQLPKASVAGALKHDDAGIQRVGIEIVVTDVRGDAQAVGRSQQERTALPLARPAGPEVADERAPTPIRDGNRLTHRRQG